MSKPADRAAEAIKREVTEQTGRLSLQDYQAVLRDIIEELRTRLDASREMDWET